MIQKYTLSQQYLVNQMGIQFCTQTNIQAIRDLIDNQCYNNIKEIFIIQLADERIIPPQYLITNPKLTDRYGNTIAMLLAYSGIIAPKYLYHNPQFVSKDNNTVAMILASQGIIPPKEWEHDKFICNNLRETVGIILANHNVIPPKQWKHDIDDIKDKYKNTIRTCLYKYGYQFKNGQFVANCKFINLEDTCQICLNQDRQNFVKTVCGHKICQLCFNQMIKEQMINNCPICRKQNWFIKEQSNIVFLYHKYYEFWKIISDILECIGLCALIILSSIALSFFIIHI